MTLQASGVISFSNINTELQRSSTSLLSLNDTNARELANRPSGIISLSDFYGKTWLTANDAASWYASNKAKTHNWVHGGSGDSRAVNNPYARYVSTSSWTYNPGVMSGITSRWTTIVLNAVDGGASSIHSISINGGAYVASTTTTTFNTAEMVQVVLHVETDIKNISSIAFSWNHSSGNFGSWASASILPGKWTGVNKSQAYTMSNNQIAVGVGGEGGDGPAYPLASAGGMPYHQMTAWWYNCSQHFMLVNNTGTDKTWSSNVGGNGLRSGLFTFVEG